MNHELLKKIGYNSVALEMLLKREAQINPDKIIMPGERLNLNRDDSLDDVPSSTEEEINNILNKLEEIEKLINNLPEYTIKEERYDPEDRSFTLHKKWAKEELESLTEEIKTLLRYA